MKTLETIIAPYSIEEFLNQIWTQQAIYIKGDRPGKFQHLFSWQALNDLLNYHQLKSPDLRFSQDGKSLPDSVDVKEWRDRLNQGATLIVNRLHERVPALVELAAQLRHEIGYRTQINLYCSPAQQQGFDCHYDTHDVFILQIGGEKEWFVFRDTVPYPLAETRSPDQLPPNEPPYLQVILKPGDVLYIPRGHWHYAVACNQPSLHLTIGVDNQTGVDLLGWLAEQLHNEPEWRQSFPPLAQAADLDKQLDALQQHMLNYLQHSDWKQAFLRDVAQRDLPPLPISLPGQLGIGLFDHGWESRFGRSPLHSSQIESMSDTHHHITIGTKHITLKHVSRQLVQHMFGCDSFNLLDLADWAPDLDFEADVVPLLTHLVQQGVLMPMDTSG